ncbi:DAK2 domain-containing protein [Haloechinothrix sp. YIM 98757]|uniref:DAK2 domain-containing protein n=1 Tax=Haloechinothrix aidingensis TaxID=2752311 RepID=A0A837ZXG0_9PSEU|nr:DAK2 domain-containing protein [Haloechinothrix aidingensis]MBA0124854.1 DAK2 domain-containing protein [Haloechinothrix aidingensis]
MQALRVAEVSAWAAACVRSLEGLRADIDSINVYPVADSDTGSNLVHTVTGAHEALVRSTPDAAGRALDTLARGAIAAARGNSGVILSQALRGMAEACRSRDSVDAETLISGLIHADRLATEAVARPVDGTMLTVLHAARRGAEAEYDRTGALERTVTAAATSAAEALGRTPSQLAVLAEAGVFDAGGRGVLAVLDELVAVVTGHSACARPEFAVDASRGPAQRASSAVSSPGTASAQPWEVMYLLNGASEAALPALRDELSAIGDCVTVAGDGAGSHAVHVHCADIGAALEAGLRAGHPHQVRVESLAPQEPMIDSGQVRRPRAVLALVDGEDLAKLCSQAGARVLAAHGGQLPGTERVQRLITQLAAAHTAVLPAGPELTRVAESTVAAFDRVDRDVVVVPCSSPVQVLAALAVHDSSRRAHDDVVAMAEAAAATHRGEVSVASQDAITWVGRVAAGDVVGFVDDEVVRIQQAGEQRDDVLADVAMEVLERLLGVRGELVTVLLGAQAPEGVDAELGRRLRTAHPEVEFVAYHGGQTDSVLTIGVE